LPQGASDIASKENRKITLRKKQHMKKMLMVISLVLCFTSMRNCYQACQRGSLPQVEESYLAVQWKKEKAELEASYQRQINILETQKDSLVTTVLEQKKSLAVQRVKSKAISKKIINAVTVDSAMVSCDTLRPLIEEFITAHAYQDSICDSTILSLEQLVANRDSTIGYIRLIENIQRDLLKEQQLRNEQLTQQLNVSFKDQKRKSRQNKILAGGIMLLSGITTSVLLTKNIR